MTVRRSALRAPLALAPFVLAQAGCTDRPPTAPTRGARADLFAPLAPGAPPRYWVALKAPGAGIAADALAAAGGAQVVDSIPQLHVLVVANATNPAALQTDDVAGIEQEFTTQVDDQVAPAIEAGPAAAAAPWYQSGVQWDMRAMGADYGWANTAGGAGVNVCIVDTGVDQGHQELAGRVAQRVNFVTDTDAVERTVEDLAGHGSHVAGTVAAGGVVISGVAPGATVLSARVLNRNGSGSGTAIINGILWCADNGAHVINMSLGGRIYGSPAYVATAAASALNLYGTAIKYATDRGTAVIVAAGNDNVPLPNPGGQQVVYPAQVPGALSVGATAPVSKSTNASIATGFDPFDPAKVWQGPDGRAFYSNYGTGVDVFAPGGRGGIPFSFAYYLVNGVSQGSSLDFVYSLCAGTTSQTGAVNTGGAPGGAATCLGQRDRYIGYAGTSMATPHVAGLAALLYAQFGGTRTAAAVDRIYRCLRGTTDDIGPAATFGNGRVNERKALAAAQAGSC